MPRAWSWSIAITTPPAPGCVAPHRLERARAPARARPAATRRPTDSAVRSRWEAPTGSSASWKVARGEGAVARDPLHLAVGAREVDRAARRRRRRSRRRSRTRRRPARGRRRRSARTGSRGCPSGRASPTGDRRTADAGEGRPGGVAPGALLAGVVGLVEHDEGVPRDPRDVDRAAGDLLVGGDHAVHVGGQAARRRRSSRGSRCRSSASAASAHWVFRCWVGATTTRRRRGCSARCWRAAASAKVVLPAPGVATARKSGPGRARKASRAAFCQRRSRIGWAIGSAGP